MLPTAPITWPSLIRGTRAETFHNRSCGQDRNERGNGNHQRQPPDVGAEPTREDILEYLSDKVARWWLPDDVVFVDELPHTATGKLLKTKLLKKMESNLQKKLLKKY